MKKTDMVIYIPNYKSSYAIENRVDSLEEWKESCVEAGVDCPVDVAIANESALITFDKARPTGEFDKDVDFMRGFLADIEDARRLDMQECACESITVIRDTSPKNAGPALIEKLKQQGDFEPFDLIQISNLITGSTNEDEIYASSNEGKQIAMESNTDESVTSHTPEIPDTQSEEEVPQVENVDNEVHENKEPVIPIEPEPAIYELAEDEKEFTPEERKSIRAMLAFWKMNTRKNAEKLDKVVETVEVHEEKEPEVPEVEPVTVPINKDETETVATQVTEEEPKNDVETSEQQEQENNNEVAENTGIGEEGYCHQDALPNIQNPHAGIGTESAGLAGSVYGELNNETPSNDTNTKPVEVPEVEEDTTDAETVFNSDSVETTPNTPQELLVKLAMESASDDELFEKLLANKDALPEEVLTESTEISLFEKIKNNTIMSISPMTKMQRYMKISLE